MERICREDDCASGGAPQPLDNFPLNGDKKGGRRWQCKACMRRKNREWRERNRDRIYKYNRQRKSFG